ncbi:MAG: translation elongation factor 4 [Gemmatimonadota bacterium]|jgi:GTP-binding protein LepA|nr:translation elongation factor 4 [Gemmatimonadota bacterium]MDP6802371.1 translation elongation factor 4 [Gemmatimonadota bacterium]MDP7031115.1 translation elongation factor 4 [Gemmatimonadota bacterium]
MLDRLKIRNFCIIAHIDHGKSTLADRLLALTHTLSEAEAQGQVLDDMDLEKERGITIKAHAVRMTHPGPDGHEYVLNLIDTPGHVDFSYEVSRSLAACEGAVLVVDASQGVEAQTISNLHLAIAGDLTIIPVLNKIDMSGADPERAAAQVLDLLGGDPGDVLRVSARDGLGVDALIPEIIKRIPPPSGETNAPLRALIFDSAFDQYRGAVAYVRVVDGKLRAGMTIRFLSNAREYLVTEVGTLRLGMVPCETLGVGDVGYVIAGVKNIGHTKVGDTITDTANPASESLPGYAEAKSMVFSGFYPIDTEDYEDLRDALDRLRLNDASLHYEPETSVALGFGFRCGFLGLLHREIVQERLEREFNLGLIGTVPTVPYRVYGKDGTMVEIENPNDLPDPADIDRIEEPMVRAEIVVPTDYIGNMMKLGQERRGTHGGMEYIDPTRVVIHFEFPLAEIIFDFYDKLKSISRGYASFDYEFSDYQVSPMVKLDILLNGEPVDALSIIVHRDKAYEWGKSLVEKLKEVIPRHQFQVAVQAAVGSKIIARETLRALRKNVTAKCYGGDITRKRKLLERQKEGKKRMKQVGTVRVPQEAFLSVLKIDR